MDPEKVGPWVFENNSFPLLHTQHKPAHLDLNHVPETR